jgi:hypothetical protein
MKRYSALWSCLFSALLCVSLGAQWLNYPTAGVPRLPDGKPDLSAPSPRTFDGKPDLSGLWDKESNRPGTPSGLGDQPISEEFINIGWSLKQGLPYQPWAEELVKKRATEQRINDPLSHCLPIGPIRLHTSPVPRKIIQTPGLVAILNETGAGYRQIFTDGRPLPVDPNPSWNGYSTGRWEGDTLVVHTNGLRDGLWLDSAGNPSTEAAIITERFRRVNFGQLQIEVTVNDPKAYTTAWTVTLNHQIKLDSEVLEYICQENEKYMKRILGR